MKKIISLILLIIVIFLINDCKQKKENFINTLQRDSLSKKADSIFLLGKIYSDDSLNQKEALNLYNSALCIYNKAKNKNKIAKTYQYIGYAYDYEGNYDSVIKYHKKALDLNLKNDNKRMSAISANNLGIAYTITGNIDTAFIFYELGVELTELTNDTVEFIELYQNMGISYSYKGNYEKATEFTIKALKLSEQINYINSIVNLNLHIAQYYNLIGDTIKTMSYCKQASERINEIDDAYTKAGFYNTIGELHFSRNEIEEARKNFNKTLEISKKVNYKRGIAAGYTNLALLFFKEKKYSKAEKFAKLSVKLETEINNVTGVISTLIILSETLDKQNKYSEALKKLKEAEYLSKKKGLLERLPDINFHYYEIYKHINNYKQALQYFEKFHYKQDSIAETELKEKVADIEIKYQTEKKQHKIELLNEENKTKEQKLKTQNLLIVLLILILILIIGIAYFIKQKDRHKLNKIELQLQQYILQIKDINKQRKKGEKIQLKEVSEKYQLTARETDILHLISKGKSNADIAKKIFVSSNTVKYHIKNIYLKLDVKNRVEARNKIAG